MSIRNIHFKFNFQIAQWNPGTESIDVQYYKDHYPHTTAQSMPYVQITPNMKASIAGTNLLTSSHNNKKLLFFKQSF